MVQSACGNGKLHAMNRNGRNGPDAPYTWRDALDFEGGKYVGFISRAFDGFDFADMEKRPDLTEGNKYSARKRRCFLYFLPGNRW